MANPLSLKNIRFAYRGSDKLALDDVDFSINEGEFVGIVGPTGAGKSTLIRCASGIVPKFFKGPFKGSVKLNGEPIGHKKVAELAGKIGTLFQDFESQLFSTNARLELAFGMQNLGIDRLTMLERIERVSQLVGLAHLLEREPQSLSGGQKQRLALASILCLEPDLLLCDEPTTDLDPVGKQEVFEVLDRLTESGHSVGLVEHETERLVQADRIVLLINGRIEKNGPPGEVLADPDECKKFGVYAPQLFSLFHKLGLPQRPLFVDQAATLLHENQVVPKDQRSFFEPPLPAGNPLIEAEDIQFAYSPGQPILKDVSFQIFPGDFVAILGQNGSGKTTLVKHLNALLTPGSGRVIFDGKPVEKTGPAAMGRKVGFVFQNPDQMLFAENVFEEIAFGLRNFKIPEDSIRYRVEKALATVGLEGVESVDPFIMTKGGRQKLAVACVLACEPQVLILDEPTTGLDAIEQLAMMKLLKSLNDAGHTIIIITHTLEVAASFSSRSILMDDGRIIADDSTRKIFHQEELLAKTKLIAPPSVRLGTKLGIPALGVDELAEALERRVE